MDVHVGSIAIQRFIKTKQPLLTLHGHVHESAQITGWWNEKVERTYSFTAAHDGPELAVVRFDTDTSEECDKRTHRRILRFFLQRDFPHRLIRGRDMGRP